MERRRAANPHLALPLVLAPPQAAAVQLMQSAYVDPSDPTKLYVQTP